MHCTSVEQLLQGQYDLAHLGRVPHLAICRSSQVRRAYSHSFCQFLSFIYLKASIGGPSLFGDLLHLSLIGRQSRAVGGERAVYTYGKLSRRGWRQNSEVLTLEKNPSWTSVWTRKCCTTCTRAKVWWSSVAPAYFVVLFLERLVNACKSGANP